IQRRMFSWRDEGFFSSVCGAEEEADESEKGEDERGEENKCLIQYCMTKKTAEFRDNLVSPELKIIQSGKDMNHFSIIDRYTVLVHRANIHVADGSRSCFLSSSHTGNNT
ncbi:MAG TPA: hypothetical protein O0X07_01920, partial [Methanocorpusculum sp.]|nr:hypothetical protein [Methanocorpusculum sp.]